MDLQQLQDMGDSIRKAEKYLKTNCFTSHKKMIGEEGYLLWDVSSKRIQLSFRHFEKAVKKKPLMEWKIEIRKIGFSFLVEFIEGCMKSQVKESEIDAKIDELNLYLYNKREE